MNMIDPRRRNGIAFCGNDSKEESIKREAALRVAEHHFTAAEFTELLAEFASGKLDVRMYDDGIVLMRQY